MYIMCVCLFSALSRRVGALHISIIIIIIHRAYIYTGSSQGVVDKVHGVVPLNEMEDRACRVSLLTHTRRGAQVVSEAISADGSFRMMEVCSFAMSLQPSSLCLHARSSA